MNVVLVVMLALIFHIIQRCHVKVHNLVIIIIMIVIAMKMKKEKMANNKN